MCASVCSCVCDSVIAVHMCVCVHLLPGFMCVPRPADQKHGLVVCPDPGGLMIYGNVCVCVFWEWGVVSYQSCWIICISLHDSHFLIECVRWVSQTHQCCRSSLL